MQTTFESARKSKRIDYSSARVIRRRRREKIAQRAKDLAGTWVIGRFHLAEGEIKFEAIAMQPGFYVDKTAPLTREFERFYHWRTRQGARQWLLHNPDPRCQPVNLHQLRGRSD